MARARVLSFMSTFGGPPKSSAPDRSQAAPNAPLPASNSFASSPTPAAIGVRESPGALNPGRQRASSRPMSMVGGYQPPLMEIASDTIPELAPIFSFLNSHSNKLYQEGYFLKLNDLDSHGRPYPDRSWTECFAQLSGTVLSLWDAAALDAAGEDGEVAPTFINLADASVKMIETLPTRSQGMQPLTNILSVSTAGKNRYLFHFSNVTALTQWTAGIRLAMFENSSLQEAYTGSLIAGKGKTLNNIRTIMGPTKFKAEEWTRVRFGAGTPWRRCWCVISPPDEKEVAAYKKQTKKKSAYDRPPPALKGNIKFYDTSKTKKVQPIATINDAYSAYSIYPQSKPLIDQSTLIKIEGTISIHSKPETTTEGFIFVMPEVRPAVSGFEMMLRFLFPIYDIFALYGRPARLAANTMDTRSLMFAMPQNRRYGYLEIFDVATLIHTPGSQSWTEREWKKQLKQLTSARLSRISTSQEPSRDGSRHGHRNSLPSRTALRFQDNGPNRSTPSLHRDREPDFAPKPPPHTDSAPPGNGPFQRPGSSTLHHRSASESIAPTESASNQGASTTYEPSRMANEATHASMEEDLPPPPPIHGTAMGGQDNRHNEAPQYDRSSSESERRYNDAPEDVYNSSNVQDEFSPNLQPGPVAAPPAFSRQPGAKPQTRPYQSPELRRANSRMSSATLSQLAAAGSANQNQTHVDAAAAGAAAAWGRSQRSDGRVAEDQEQRGVIDYKTSNRGEMTADGLTNKDMVLEQNPTKLTDPSAQPYQSHENSPSKPHIVAKSNTSPPPPYHLHAPENTLQAPLTTIETATTAHNRSEHGHNFISQSHQSLLIQSPPSSLGFQVATSLQSSSADSESQQYHNRTSLSPRYSIARKPVGGFSKQTNVSQLDVGLSVSSQYSVEEAAFNRISTMKSAASTEVESRRYSRESSHYGDSLPSPDYASTADSVSIQRPPQATTRNIGPRTGVLKTTGVPSDSNEVITVGETHYSHPSTQQASENWHIDFGPTHVFKPEVRSSPSPNSADCKPMARAGSPQMTSGKLGVTSVHGTDPRSRSPNRSNLATPEPGHSRPSSAESEKQRRNVAWQPGGATIGCHTGRVSITAEEFVQQRAADNRVSSAHAHSRHHSGPQYQSIRQTSRTPPLTSRHGSGDFSSHRSSPPARPRSRGAASTMNISPSLSAREQEHVARVTGSPLINLTGNSTRPSSQGGLVAAIEEREREKRELKSGTNKFVQQAIMQRQQQFPTQQHAQPSPQMYMPGQFPPSPSHDLAWKEQSDAQQWIPNSSGPPNYARPLSRQYTPPGLGNQRYSHNRGDSYFTSSPGGR